MVFFKILIFKVNKYLDKPYIRHFAGSSFNGNQDPNNPLGHYNRYIEEYVEDEQEEDIPYYFSQQNSHREHFSQFSSKLTQKWAKPRPKTSQEIDNLIRTSPEILTDDEDLREMFYKGPRNYHATVTSTFKTLARTENLDSDAAFGVQRNDTEYSNLNNDYNIHENKAQTQPFSSHILSNEDWLSPKNKLNDILLHANTEDLKATEPLNLAYKKVIWIIWILNNLFSD